MGAYTLREPDYVLDLSHDGWKLQARKPAGAPGGGQFGRSVGTVFASATSSSSRTTTSTHDGRGHSILKEVLKASETKDRIELTDRGAIRHFEHMAHEERLSLYHDHGLDLAHPEITDDALIEKWQATNDRYAKALLEVEVKKRLKILQLTASTFEAAALDSGRDKTRQFFDSFDAHLQGTKAGAALLGVKARLLADDVFDKFAAARHKTLVGLKDYGAFWRDHIAESLAVGLLLGPLGFFAKMLGAGGHEEYAHILEATPISVGIATIASVIAVKTIKGATAKKRAAAKVIRDAKRAKKATLKASLATKNSPGERA